MVQCVETPHDALETRRNVSRKIPYSSQKKTKVNQVVSRLSSASQGNSMPFRLSLWPGQKVFNRKELKELKEGGFFLKQEIARSAQALMNRTVGARENR